MLPLITPHGDLEPSEPDECTEYTPSHYPSWGSGTLPRRAEVRTRRTTHYPSWGSGTRPDEAPRPRERCSHYPSWGSGTRVIEGGRGDHRDLITPHGDLELDRFEDVPRGVLTLITPHGDLEPLKSPMYILSSSPHYPSWGSGTVHFRPRDRVRERLITPHGDLEPLRSEHPIWQECRLITPHGDLELRLFPPQQDSVSRSLPLMGIWNDAAVLVQAVDVEFLITPHGDLEPCSAFVCSASSLRSLPLMGIWNRFMSPIALHQVEVSLPLMGIWNRVYRRHARRGAGPSHYPSWGSGTASPACPPRWRPRSHYPSWGSGTPYLPKPYPH